MLHIAAFAIPFLAISTSAWGDILPANSVTLLTSVTGNVWRVNGNLQGAPTSLAGVSAMGGASEGTFTAGKIDFNSGGPDDNNLNGFLLHGGATTGSITGGLGDLMSGAIAADPGHSCYGNTTLDADCYSTVIEITGSYYFQKGVTYSLTHDDGAVLFVGGIPKINFPGPVSATTDNWTPGADITDAFDLWYMGTNGNPEVLRLSAATPEPTSIIFLGTALIGLGRLLRRKFPVV